MTKPLKSRVRVRVRVGRVRVRAVYKRTFTHVLFGRLSFRLIHQTIRFHHRNYFFVQCTCFDGSTVF